MRHMWKITKYYFIDNCIVYTGIGIVTKTIQCLLRYIFTNSFRMSVVQKDSKPTDIKRNLNCLI